MNLNFWSTRVRENIFTARISKAITWELAGIISCTYMHSEVGSKSWILQIHNKPILLENSGTTFSELSLTVSMLIQIKYIIEKINFTFKTALSHTLLFMKSSSKPQKERSHDVWPVMWKQRKMRYHTTQAFLQKKCYKRRLDGKLKHET